MSSKVDSKTQNIFNSFIWFFISEIIMSLSYVILFMTLVFNDSNYHTNDLSEVVLAALTNVFYLLGIPIAIIMVIITLLKIKYSKTLYLLLSLGFNLLVTFWYVKSAMGVYLTADVNPFASQMEKDKQNQMNEMFKNQSLNYQTYVSRRTGYRHLFACQTGLSNNLTQYKMVLDTEKEHMLLIKESNTQNVAAIITKSNPPRDNFPYSFDVNHNALIKLDHVRNAYIFVPDYNLYFYLGGGNGGDAADSRIGPILYDQYIDDFEYLGTVFRNLILDDVESNISR